MTWPKRVGNGDGGLFLCPRLPWHKFGIHTNACYQQLNHLAFDLQVIGPLDLLKPLTQANEQGGCLRGVGPGGV